MSDRLVVIGNGMAPGRMLERLLERAPERLDITVFNAEPRVNYDRLMLSPVLSGEKSYADIVTHDDDWYAGHGITLHKGARITAIDREARTVTSENGLVADYDRLVIATGSTPYVLPLPGAGLPGVEVYRDLDDVETMLEVCRAAGPRGRRRANTPCAGRAVVIGGGLLGLEAADGLHRQGMDVTVLHRCGHLMDRQLDPAAAHLLELALIERGITVMTGADTCAILGEDRVTGVELTDGTRLDAELVVMAVGIRPSTALAESAGLAVHRGVLVDDRLRTSDPAISALGECVEHRDTCYGLVAPLYEMAAVLADDLADPASTSRYGGSLVSTRLKVTGIDLFSAGDFADGEGREEVVLRDAGAGVYKRLVLEANRIVGVVLYGEAADGPWFFDLMKRRADVAELRETLIFGQAYQGGAALDPTAAVAALPDEAEICGCNGVCKGAIVRAIGEHDLTTLDAVRARTKASSSCGSCTGLVEQLMGLTLGERYAPAAVTPMCGCTHHGHDEVRRLVRARALKTIPAVMQALEWTSSGGCAKCRPALNYYLVADWPEEYEDDYQSRFINERAHANIQKDGTYSVVPRMWGGMTTAAELRAIADVVDRYEIPAVKVTGGQRIDMLGVTKENLPRVWADLGEAGFVSGHAYAKGLRTVKTCVGKTWCRFGTQDSTGLGIRLERYLWGSWTPAKVKLAVSGCPRNCAEATCKDIGVICVESGFDLHFAGAAGLDIRGTELLGHVATEDEVLDHVAALVQMYREQGHYLERIYKWATRVGLDEIRRRIMEDGATRSALRERFEASQRIAQIDPWAERASGRIDGHEFAPLAPARESPPNALSAPELSA